MLEREYVNLIKETINEVANDYKNDNEVDSVLLWDTMKLQIRSSSLHYAKKKKAKMKSQETSLEVDILALQRKLEENNFYCEAFNVINISKAPRGVALVC